MRRLLKQLFAVKSDKPDETTLAVSEAVGRNDAAASALEDTLRVLLEQNRTVHLSRPNRG